ALLPRPRSTSRVARSTSRVRGPTPASEEHFPRPRSTSPVARSTSRVRGAPPWSGAHLPGPARSSPNRRAPPLTDRLAAVTLPELAPGAVVGGRYVVVRRLEGEKGPVYAVRPEPGDRLQALQLLPPELVEGDRGRERFEE